MSDSVTSRNKSSSGKTKDTNESLPPASSSFASEAVLDVIYWARQAIAVVLGLVWGVLAIQGLVGMAGYAIVSTAFLILFLNQALQLDEDEYGGRWELIKEGFMSAFPFFLVVWIIVYTGLHF